ncbi:hypothetical protein NUW58_g7674 [Xylaria curta]|uniref:Uncharacterized protein n=1 Tax=Xylaria curta TaxID=42375 RepID=A0ACC1NEW8_9PEZI|nr:hypothetical protein NUW58_g7674 [Xylaria curta]
MWNAATKRTSPEYDDEGLSSPFSWTVLLSLNVLSIGCRQWESTIVESLICDEKSPLDSSTQEDTSVLILSTSKSSDCVQPTVFDAPAKCKTQSHSPQTALSSPELPPEVKNGTTKRMNLFQAVNDALTTALVEDENVLIFGEDVAFGGVFRCTMKLAENFGAERVFNTPLTEQGIMGFGIGLAAEGMRPVAEIQFADYVFPAFDQLVNEAAKYRYREGKTGRSAGGLTVRMPCGGVGHGALYHSQSPESLFTHIPGLRVIMPRSPLQAKGLLLSAIRSNDPCIFMEPKILYRAAVEQVPASPYTLPLSKAEVLKEGENVTIISYGQPLYTCQAALQKAEQDLGISVELIDLRTVYPWDRETVLASVRKTGRCMVVHESMVNAGIGAEVSAVDPKGMRKRFCASDGTHSPGRGLELLSHCRCLFENVQQFPDVARIYDGIKKLVEY